MRKLTRNTNPLPPLQPESVSPPEFNYKGKRTDTASEISWWRRIVNQERRRHGQVEQILTRHITSLEQQIVDLRGLYLRSITLKPSQSDKTEKK